MPKLEIFALLARPAANYSLAGTAINIIEYASELIHCMYSTLLIEPTQFEWCGGQEEYAICFGDSECAFFFIANITFLLAIFRINIGGLS